MKQQILWVVEILCKGEWQKSVFCHERRQNARTHAKSLRSARMDVRVAKYIRSE